MEPSQREWEWNELTCQWANLAWLRHESGLALSTRNCYIYSTRRQEHFLLLLQRSLSSKGRGCRDRCHCEIAWSLSTLSTHRWLVNYLETYLVVMGLIARVRIEKGFRVHKVSFSFSESRLARGFPAEGSYSTCSHVYPACLSFDQCSWRCRGI